MFAKDVLNIKRNKTKIEDLTGNNTFFQFHQRDIGEGNLLVASIRNGGTIYTNQTSSSISNLVRADDVLNGYLYIRKYN